MSKLIFPKIIRCDCYASCSDECVCGAWDNSQRDTTIIEEAYLKSCNCDDNSCPACKMVMLLYPNDIKG